MASLAGTKTTLMLPLRVLANDRMSGLVTIDQINVIRC